MPWPEGWPIQNCLRRKCEILIHTCAFRRCLTFCRCSPQISLDGPMPSEALACLIKWQCEGDERSRRTSAKGHFRPRLGPPAGPAMSAMSLKADVNTACDGVCRVGDDQRLDGRSQVPVAGGNRL